MVKISLQLTPEIEDLKLRKRVGDYYYLEARFSSHKSGGLSYEIELQAIHRATGKKSIVCTLLPSKAPQYVTVNDMDNCWVIPSWLIGSFIDWLERLDGYELERLFNKDRTEGEWQK